MKYTKLFSPGTIGNLTIKNRSVMAPMGDQLNELDGTVGEKSLGYFEARAKGGAGLIITGVTRVNTESGISVPRQLSAAKDSDIAELAKIADTVHRYDCRIFAQLMHPGNTAPASCNSRVLSPSGIASRSGNKSSEMSRDDIESLVRDFADAAFRVKQSGFDGVEIHGAHFYLIHQFICPLFNFRDDEYGGSLENRFRFLKEIVLAVREKCGKDFPLSVRLSVEEYVGENGMHPDEGIQICRWLEELGIDVINVTASGSASNGSQSIESSSYRQGWRRFLVKAVKHSVNIPVIGVCVMRDPAFAEKMLEDGDLDFVASGRNHLADPEWENKAMADDTKSIRRCISCTRCIESIKKAEGLICSVNPCLGNEYRQNASVCDGNGRSVIVLGAGPAGLTAAEYAAKRGFKVTVFEKEQYAGGLVFLASNISTKTKMRWFAEDAMYACEKAGVNFCFGKTVSNDEIKSLHPYAIIDATGGDPVIPGNIIRTDRAIVHTPADILSGRVKPYHELVLIVGAGLTGLETAEYLWDCEDVDVMIMEKSDSVAPGAYDASRIDAMAQLDLHHTIIMTNRELVEIRDNSVLIRHTVTGQLYELPVDRVVLSLGVKSKSGQNDELAQYAERFIRVGDAAKASRIREAVFSAYNAVQEL